MRRSGGGFTLIEAMIVMAIIAILASIAYPGYRDTVARSRRADARMVLLENAQAIERHYTVSNAYDRKADGSALAAPDIREAPKDGTAKYYDIEFTGTHDAAQYTLRAVPKGAMAGDTCGSLTLTHTGERGATGTESVQRCWDR